jgi:hypothetical protein
VFFLVNSVDGYCGQMILLGSYPMCLMRRSFDGFGTPSLMLCNRFLFGVVNGVCGKSRVRC